MTATTCKRRDDRVLTRLKAYCSFGRVEGTAALANISYSGALIEDTSMRPKIELVHLETPSELNPIGVKGAGESGIIPVAAAIASAVADAAEGSSPDGL